MRCTGWVGRGEMGTDEEAMGGVIRVARGTEDEAEVISAVRGMEGEVGVIVAAHGTREGVKVV
jgi:hypothetical protein